MRKSQFYVLRFLLTCVYLSVLAVSCSSDKEQGNTIVVSVEPQKTILEEIAGDRFKVIAVLQPGSNPETFEPTMNTRREIEAAKAFFTTGNLPFEQSLSASLPSGMTEFNVTGGIVPVYGTHGHEHAHQHGHSQHQHDGQPDPHVWGSVRNAKIMARNMYEALLELDPEGEDYYETRLKGLERRLDSLDNVFSTQLSRKLPTRAFAVWHPSLSYLARDYDLEQISVGFENKEMPATHLARVIDEARADSVKIFFFQREYDSRQAEALNERMGTELITINPLSPQWEAELKKVVDALSR